jgi:ABC-2 type transport system permease protein
MMRKGNLQIIWTIAAKDIMDAVKNKATLFFLILTVVMILMNNISFSEGSIPEVVIYSGGNSSLIQKLRESSGMEVNMAGTLQEMEEQLGGENDVVLGLWIRDDIDVAQESGDEITLEGYVVHWAKDTQIEKLKSEVEERIEGLVGWDVSIHVDGNRVYPHPGLFGHAWEVSFSMVLVLTFLALFLVPNLVVVEKRTKTMDALLVSPASAGQMILAKALTGMFYYLMAVVVILTFNWELVVHLGILGVAVIGGGLFSIGLGLLLGYLLDRQMVVNAIGYALLMGLMAPIFLTLFTSYLPDLFRDLLGLVPTVSFAKLLELTFSGGIFLEQVVFSGAVLLLSGVLVWLILSWRAWCKGW